MEMPLPVNIKTLFDLEVLRARLEIRDFFLKNLFREVYENIGQMLSLVRVMLASPGAGTERASELVGKSIRDLRQMCKSFFPDADLLKQNGFANGIKETVEILYPGSQSIKLIEATEDIEPGRMLIVFSLVLEIVSKIREIKGELETIFITFTPHKTDLVISYTGEAIKLEESTVQQRAALINGAFNLSKDAGGITHIKFMSL